MKKIACIVIALGMIALTTACAQSEVSVADTIGGKTYVWEKDGFGGDFTITLGEDGTYEYYEGVLSSYMGRGEWSVENGVVTMKEDPKNETDYVFHFTVKDGNLCFEADDSSSFMYTKVEDGDMFTVQQQ